MQTNHRQFVFLFLTNFFFFMGQNSMNILPAYLSSLGAGSDLIGAFNTVPLLMLAVIVVLQLFRGKTFHKLKMIRYSFLCGLVGSFGMFIFKGNLPVMFVFYLLTGITYGAGFTNIFSMMYDIVDKEKQRSSAAIFGISGLMSSGFAAALAQWIYGLNPAFFLFLPMGFTAVAFLLSWTLQPACFILVEKESFSFKNFRSLPGIKSLIFQALIFGGGFGVFKTFIPLFTQSRLGVVDITRFFAFYTVAGIFYRLVFARLMDRFSHRMILGGGFMLMLLTILGLGWITKQYQLYILGAIYGLAHSLLFPTFSAEFVRCGKENKAAYNNIFLAVFAIGMTLSSSVLGILGNIFGLSVIPYTMSALIIIAGISLFLSKEKCQISK